MRAREFITTPQQNQQDIELEEGLGKYAAGALAAGALGYGVLATDPPASDTNTSARSQDCLLYTSDAADE